MYRFVIPVVWNDEEISALITQLLYNLTVWKYICSQPKFYGRKENTELLGVGTNAYAVKETQQCENSSHSMGISKHK